MKTFFIALFLGIFIGAIVTAYFKTPEEFSEILTPERKEKIDDKLDRIGDKLDGYKEQIEEKLDQESEAPAKEAEEEPTPVAPEPPDTEAKPIPEETVSEEEPSMIEKLSTKATSLFESSADKRIKSNIISKFKLNGDVDIDAINVDVKDGVVTLTGILSDASLSAKVSLLAIETKGVKNVVSEIDIAPAE